MEIPIPVPYILGLVVITNIGCPSPHHEVLQHQTSVEELRQLEKEANTAALETTGKPKLWGKPAIPINAGEAGVRIYRDSFHNLNNWHHEGIGQLTQPERNLMQLNCAASAQGKEGCMAFCKADFPDSIRIDIDLRVLTTNGLFIAFLACRGRRGEDMLLELPERSGSFADYVYNPDLRSYHLSISRYDDEGTHTGVSNWRRNPGLFLMGQQPDLCKEPNRWYHIAIVKKGPYLQLSVDNSFAGGCIDLDEIPDDIPRSGKIGFRAIGRDVIVQLKNFVVSRAE
jgi:hypothetical protein